VLSTIGHGAKTARELIAAGRQQEADHRNVAIIYGEPTTVFGNLELTR
jgi:hypothetical protein